MDKTMMQTPSGQLKIGDKASACLIVPSPYDGGCMEAFRMRGAGFLRMHAQWALPAPLVLVNEKE